MEFKHIGKKIVAAVAQKPFTLEANTFCKLIPLFDHLNPYEKLLSAGDFFNDGEIWWRLSTSTDPARIVPGMMMELVLERSQEVSLDPSKSNYQARFTGPEETLGTTCGAEVLPAPRETFQTLCRLKGNGGEIALPHVPSKRIYLKVENAVYGPFQAEVATPPASGTAGTFRVRAARGNGTQAELFRMPAADFSSRYSILRNAARVALDEGGTLRARNLAEVTYEYLSPDVCSQIEGDFAGAWERLDWEPLSAKFFRMSGKIGSFGRGDRQNLREMVKKLESVSEMSAFPGEFAAAVQELRKADEGTETALRELAVTLMESGVMDEKRLKDAEDEYWKNWIEKKRNDLEDEISDLREERDELNRRCDEEANRLTLDRERRKQEQKKEEQRLRQSLEKEKDRARKEIESARKQWRTEHAGLEEALAAKQRKVEALLEEIKSRTEKSAADVIAMLPFLREAGLGGARPAETREAAPASGGAVFAVPQSLAAGSPAAKTVVSEEAFLAKLKAYAEGQGFAYDLNDLRRFHVSVLCADITILEGPAGVGKSSLARLYGDVLAGAGAAYPREGTHIVHVSPAWVERADLLGYVNTVTGEFSPSEEGLYQRLVLAEADAAKNGGASAMYPICLDEMNLAQVEHYFSDFMQILELPDRRELRCFSRDAVSPGAVFRDHASVFLPHTVRFIGTVNFDETTRRLSSRLLDRANLVYLGGGARARAAGGRTDAGPGVCASTYQSWRRTAPLSVNVEKHLGDLAEHLRVLGVTVSPRVRSAMETYIASAVPLIGMGMKAENIAFDEQLAQRVLSKVRSITSVKQRKALDAVSEIVDGFRDEAVSPSRAAIDRLRDRERFFGYESEG